MEHTLTHADITGDYNGYDSKITPMENYSNSHEKDFNQSKSKNVGCNRRSPVWEFAEKLNSEQSRCKLCSRIVGSIGGSTTSIRGHILRIHKDTEEGRKLRLLVKKKKKNRINEMSEYLTPNKTENTEKLKEDMIIYLTGEQYKCKVCEITENQKHIIEEHIDSHLEKHFLQTNSEVGFVKNTESVFQDNIHEPDDEVKAMKTQSPVWEYAEKLDNRSAKCKLCSQIIGSIGGSTGTITKHILYKHGETEEGMKLKIITDKNKIKRKIQQSELLHSNADIESWHIDIVEYSQPNVQNENDNESETDTMAINETANVESNTDNISVSEISDEVTSLNKIVTTNSNYEMSSPIWQFAIKLDRTRAQCKVCSKLFFVVAANTSNLRKHILTNHTKEANKLRMLTENKKISNKLYKYEKADKMSKIIKQGKGNPLKLKSPVWQFIKKFPSGIGQCKLCSHTGKRSAMTAHFLDDHPGTEQEVEIKMFEDNKKLNKKLKKVESLPKQLDTHEDMIIK